MAATQRDSAWLDRVIREEDNPTELLKWLDRLGWMHGEVAAQYVEFFPTCELANGDNIRYEDPAVVSWLADMKANQSDRAWHDRAIQDDDPVPLLSWLAEHGWRGEPTAIFRLGNDRPWNGEPTATGTKRSLLCIAIESAGTRILQALLTAGIDLAELRQETGRGNPYLTFGYETVLHQAVLCGMVEHVRLLLEYGASVDLHNPSLFCSPLNTMITLGSPNEFEMSQLLPVPGTDGVSSLRRLEMMQLLLDHGTDCESSLHVAARQGEPSSLVRFLIEQGGADVNSTSFFGRTALLETIDVTTFRVLIEAGADVHHRDSSGNSALHQLLGCHRMTHPFGDDYRDDEEFEAHFRHIRRAALKILIQEGADVNAVCDNGMTPLFLLFQSLTTNDPRLFDEDIWSTMLEAGVDLHYKDHFGRGALFYSMIWRARVSCFSVKLLDCGLNVNAADTFGRSILHHAAMIRIADIQSILDLKGVDIHAIDVCGWTPLHYSTSYGNPRITTTLIQHGARVQAVDIDGRTPLHLSAFSFDMPIGIVVPLVNDGHTHTWLQVLAFSFDRPVGLMCDINKAKMLNMLHMFPNRRVHRKAAQAVETAKILLAQGGVDALAQDNDGNLPFLLACHAPHTGLNIAFEMLQAGAARGLFDVKVK
jgi:ankyrin repeat protein